MSMRIDEEKLAITKFGVGQRVTRREDDQLLRGKGQYTDDINLPGQAHAVMVRSMIAHGIIKGIDTFAAKAMPGVLAVYTAKDLAEYGGLPCRPPMVNRDGSPMKKPVRPALAADKVRFVGDPVACVVAETLEQARDAAEAVTVDIEQLPAVVDVREAAKPGAPQLYDDIPGNLSLDYHYGDSDKVAAAFKAAAHVTTLRIIDNRVVVNAMEPRAAVAAYDGVADKFTVYAHTQGVTGSRGALAEIMKVKPEQVRFVAVNVGGSFGLKAGPFPEYVCAMHGARALKRPVKWNDTRSESFLSDHHGRAQDFDCSLALDKDGVILALKVDGYGDYGAYLSIMQPLFSTLNIVKHTASVYTTPLIEVHSRGILTNTVPITAYRGAGRPEGNYFMERMIEEAAREMGIDSVELRRRNHIQPSQIPYTAASASVYDSGNFPAILDKALEVSDWAGYGARKADSEKKGLIRGRGLGQFLEMTAAVPGEYGGIKFDADGSVLISTGTHDHGQGHWSSFAQVVTDQLGIPFDKIRLMQSDSDQLKTGTGTGGSKSMVASGFALIETGKRVIDKGREAASHLLEASPADIRFEAGRFTIAGTDRSIGITEVAQRLAMASKLPEGCPASLDTDHVNEMAPATYPNGCHVCEVEIDPATGVIEIAKYAMVGDFGTMVNPLLVEGQLHGGVVQAIGQCLMEDAVYSQDGQLVTGSFMDYSMPRAEDVPSFETIVSLPDRCKTNPLGAKGCGEAGCAGAMTSVMNAIVDALRPYGINHIDMPATPEKVWRIVNKRS
jgi:carbon-monoxide dehydrogenase large subunit